MTVTDVHPEYFALFEGDGSHPTVSSEWRWKGGQAPGEGPNVMACNESGR